MEYQDRVVIDKYHGLSRIKDSFRVIKSNFNGRPVYVKTPEHINAHFLVCFVALTIFKVIQHKVLARHDKKKPDSPGWESGVTTERIKKALCAFASDALPNGYYRLTASLLTCSSQLRRWRLTLISVCRPSKNCGN
jgi:hypothetical protein